MTVEGSGDRVLVIPKTKSPGPRAGCLATLTVFAKGVRGPLRLGRRWRRATSGGLRDRTQSSACGNVRSFQPPARKDLVVAKTRRGRMLSVAIPRQLCEDSGLTGTVPDEGWGMRQFSL